MNELTERTINLPDTIEDLTQFVLVGKAKLQAYMLKLQAVNKLSVAQEIRDQTLKEAQEISAALIAAEQRIGEILLEIPKASGQYAKSENRPVSKNTLIKEQGYTKDEASDYQRMAKNPDIVQKVIDDAIAKGEVVTRSQVMKEIRSVKEAAKESARQEARNEVADEMAALRQENMALKNRKPETVTVVPDDYERFKSEARKSEQRRLEIENQKAIVGKKNMEIHKLEEKLKEEKENSLREKSGDNLRKMAYVFKDGCQNFLHVYGGNVFLSEKMDELSKELSKEEIHDLLWNIKKIYEWSKIYLSSAKEELYGLSSDPEADEE